MRRAVRLATMVAATAGALPAPALAQSSEDPFDVTRGARALLGSETDSRFPISEMIDGTVRPTLFDGAGPAGTLDLAVISFGDGSRRVSVRGVEVYTLADGGVEDGVRGVSRFRLIADTDRLPPNGFPDDEVLVDANPVDDGTVNRYFFPAVSVYSVLFEFTRSSDAGPRVIEVDGVAVPEPSAGAAVLAAGALAALRRRRRA